jgi:hypothetical protein
MVLFLLLEVIFRPAGRKITSKREEIRGLRTSSFNYVGVFRHAGAKNAYTNTGNLHRASATIGTL